MVHLSKFTAFNIENDQPIFKDQFWIPKQIKLDKANIWKKKFLTSYDSILRHYLSDTGLFLLKISFIFILPSDWLVLSPTQKIK